MSSETVKNIVKLMKTLNVEELIEVEVESRAELSRHKFDERSEYDRAKIAQAVGTWQSYGEIEIDECSACVSESDSGAYVQAWVWVYNAEDDEDDEDEEDDE